MWSSHEVSKRNTIDTFYESFSLYYKEEKVVADMIEKLIDRIADEVVRRLKVELDLFSEVQCERVDSLENRLVRHMNQVAEQDQRVARISREVADAVVKRFKV